MKSLAIIFLSLFIAIAPMKQSQAAVAGVAALIGAPAVAATLAVTGLATAGTGLIATLGAVASDNCDQGLCGLYAVLGFYFGAILLDDNGNVEFSELTHADAAKIGINKQQADTYNSELEEVNLVFNEISSELNEESTIEDSKQLWNSYKQHLSADTFSALQKLAQANR